MVLELISQLVIMCIMDDHNGLSEEKLMLSLEDKYILASFIKLLKNLKICLMTLIGRWLFSCWI